MLVKITDCEDVEGMGDPEDVTERADVDPIEDVVDAPSETAVLLLVLALIVDSNEFVWLDGTLGEED